MPTAECRHHENNNELRIDMRWHGDRLFSREHTMKSAISPSLDLKRLSILLAALSGLTLSACNQGNKSPAGANIPEVGVVSLAPQTLTLNSELAGRATAQVVAQIRPQIGGIVQKRVFTEGAQVKVGELLYLIDPASYQATYASAQATVARAEATLAAARLKAKRQKELLAIEAISQQDNEDAQVALQQAEADLASAKAALDTARINLERTRITSPIAGRIEVSTVTPGALVTANQETALTTVQQLDPIYIDVPQSSVDALQLRQALTSGKLKTDADASAKVQIILEDGSIYKHEGRLQFSGVTVNTTTGALTLRAQVPNPEHLLMPGMYLRVKLDKGTDPNALLVPQSGIGRDNAGRPTALVVSPDDKVELRKVSVAEVVGQNWRVTEGLQAGDRVIIEGSLKARPGQTVHAVETQPGRIEPASARDKGTPSPAAGK